MEELIASKYEDILNKRKTLYMEILTSEKNLDDMIKETISTRRKLQSVSWSLAEFRHNKIVQSPHENYFNVCRQHKEK